VITTLSVKTSSHSEFVDITSEVTAAIKKSGVEDGLVIVYVPHTTAGITINEHADSSVASDMLKTLDQIVPWKNNYYHSEGNSAAHIKTSLMGSSIRVIIETANLVLGTWQGIFFCEFDGPRSRKVIIKILKST